MRIKLRDCKDFIIGVCYRSPRGTREEEQNLVRCHEYYAEKGAVIMGDYNYPDIDWDLMHAGRDANYFMEAVRDASMTQHVKEATRGTNILDLVFSSEPGMVEGLSVECPIANSDHSVILWRAGCDVVQDNGGQRV